MQKKILIATGIFAPDIGGPATYSKLLYDKLPEKGFSVEVVSFGDVRHLPKIIRHIAYFFKMLLHAGSCDVVYAQDPVSVGLPALLASRILHKTFYVKIVGDYAWEQGVQRAGVTDLLDDFSREYEKYPLTVRLLKRVQCYVARSADRVITPSNYLKKIITHWGISPEKIVVIYNGFDAPLLGTEKEVVRKGLGIEGFAILSIGRLVPWKGFAMLIDMMPTLIRTIPDAHLFIAGDGPDRSSLKQKVSALKLEQRITFLGKLSQERLFDRIVASDVFVLNTSYEGFSHQILEVMALGTPVVTTPVGGNIEIVHDHQNGVLVPYNDRTSFEKVIKELYTNRALKQNLAKEARATVKHFSNERMLEATVRELA